MFKSYKTSNYIFYFNENSIAEKEIKQIAAEQEQSFRHICDTLNVNFNETIEYYLLDSPKEVGKLFGNNEPCNGFAMLGENKIYAVYNKDIQCIGPHEDCHLISLKINVPKSDFLVEGLAMFFDKTWWQIDNDMWTSYYMSKGFNYTLGNLLNLNSNDFYDIDCAIAYPIAGSFTKFLIFQHGIEKYIDFYKCKNAEFNMEFKKVYNIDFYDVEKAFWKYIKEINVPRNVKGRMDKLFEKHHDKN